MPAPPPFEGTGPTGLPAEQLTVDPNQAKAGDVVHIVLFAPPGGVATVDFTPQPPPIETIGPR
jgi:hypothetical protein